MESFRDIIDDIGAEPLARLLGLKKGHVHVMRWRNSVPPKYWGVLTDVRPKLSHPELRRLYEQQHEKQAEVA